MDRKLELYKIANLEYQFQQKLNADRNRFFLLLNSALILLILLTPKSPWFSTVPLVVVEIVIFISSCQSLIKGRLYQKKAYEHMENTRKKLATKNVMYPR